MSVDGKQHLSEVVFSALFGSSSVRKVSELQMGTARSFWEPYQESKESGEQQESGFSPKKSESSARNVLEAPIAC